MNSRKEGVSGEELAIEYLKNEGLKWWSKTSE